MLIDEESRGGTEQLYGVESPEPFSHWMLREIHEQPRALAETLSQYVAGDLFRTEICGPIFAWLERTPSRIVIAASGSSRHAGLVAELLIESLSGIAVDVEYASEFLYRAEKGLGDASVLVVSQSGETADTLAALRKANGAGHQTLAVTNVPQSTMSNEAALSFPTFASPERAIPATKSFTAQLLNMHLLSLMAAVSRDCLEPRHLTKHLAQAADLPARIAEQLIGWERSVRRIASSYKNARNFLYLGRGLHYPIAREGALKLKESAYLHAEGYPAGELKHGPNALVAEGTPLVMIATVDHARSESVQRYEKIVQLLRDMRRQQADVIALANIGDREVTELAAHTIFVEEMPEALLAIAEIIPLQLFAYFVATQSGIDVDRPRNLTKAVLAE
jgi:glucosamine--fructose-6-phosphate aminotransferase (isomerizing)